MRMMTIGLAALFALAGLKAQAPKVDPAAATEACAKLVAEFDAATAEYRAKLNKLAQSPEYKAVAEKRDQKALTELRKTIPAVDAAGFATRFAEHAKANAGHEAAVPFLVWIAKNGPRDAARGAIDTLLGTHVASAGLEPLAESAMQLQRHYDPTEGVAVLQKIIDGSPHALVRAHAMVALARGMSRRGGSEADKAKAQELMAQAEKLAAGTELAATLAAPRFEKEHLQIGMVAPDIEGEDLAGVKFKLSDYRGKVVVLDFWGDW